MNPLLEDPFWGITQDVGCMSHPSYPDCSSGHQFESQEVKASNAENCIFDSSHYQLHAAQYPELEKQQDTIKERPCRVRSRRYIYRSYRKFRKGKKSQDEVWNTEKQAEMETQDLRDPTNGPSSNLYNYLREFNRGTQFMNFNADAYVGNKMAFSTTIPGFLINPDASYFLERKKSSSSSPLKHMEELCAKAESLKIKEPSSSLCFENYSTQAKFDEMRSRYSVARADGNPLFGDKSNEHLLRDGSYQSYTNNEGQHILISTEKAPWAFSNEEIGEPSETFYPFDNINSYRQRPTKHRGNVTNTATTPHSVRGLFDTEPDSIDDSVCSRSFVASLPYSPFDYCDDRQRPIATGSSIDERLRQLTKQHEEKLASSVTSQLPINDASDSYTAAIKSAAELTTSKLDKPMMDIAQSVATEWIVPHEEQSTGHQQETSHNREQDKASIRNPFYVPTMQSKEAYKILSGSHKCFNDDTPLETLLNRATCNTLWHHSNRQTCLKVIEALLTVADFRASAELHKINETVRKLMVLAFDKKISADEKSIHQNMEQDSANDTLQGVKSQSEANYVHYYPFLCDEMVEDVQESVGDCPSDNDCDSEDEDSGDGSVVVDEDFDKDDHEDSDRHLEEGLDENADENSGENSDEDLDESSDESSDERSDGNSNSDSNEGSELSDQEHRQPQAQPARRYNRLNVMSSSTPSIDSSFHVRQKLFFQNGPVEDIPGFANINNNLNMVFSTYRRAHRNQNCIFSHTPKKDKKSVASVQAYSKASEKSEPAQASIYDVEVNPGSFSLRGSESPTDKSSASLSPESSKTNDEKVKLNENEDVSTEAEASGSRSPQPYDNIGYTPPPRRDVSLNNRMKWCQERLNEIQDERMGGPQTGGWTVPQLKSEDFRRVFQEYDLRVDGVRCEKIRQYFDKRGWPFTGHCFTDDGLVRRVVDSLTWTDVDVIVPTSRSYRRYKNGEAAENTIEQSIRQEAATSNKAVEENSPQEVSSDPDLTDYNSEQETTSEDDTIAGDFEEETGSEEGEEFVDIPSDEVANEDSNEQKTFSDDGEDYVMV